MCHGIEIKLWTIRKARLVEYYLSLQVLCYLNIIENNTGLAPSCKEDRGASQLVYFITTLVGRNGFIMTYTPIS